MDECVEMYMGIALAVFLGIVAVAALYYQRKYVLQDAAFRERAEMREIRRDELVEKWRILQEGKNWELLKITEMRDLPAHYR